MSRTNQIGKHATVVSTDSDGFTKVVYQKTTVVSFDAHTIKLDTGGWETRTTKLRMNQASNQFGLGYYVYQEDWDWYCRLPNGDVEKFTGLLVFSRNPKIVYGYNEG